MNFSYWEFASWLSNIDFTIAGSGITGLNCALRLKERFPKANILILERGLLPNGASTKNAGFACFGSLSEILDDLKTHSEEEVLQLIKQRLEGLELLRKNLSDTSIDYQKNGGYELFTKEDKPLFQECEEQIEKINTLLLPIFGEDVFKTCDNNFKFKNIQPKLIFNKFEGQINTGKMMTSLLQKVQEKGIKILNNVTVKSFQENGDFVEIITDQFEFKAHKFFIATNGFAAQLGIDQVKPARAQVLITKPIENLHIKGTFHLDKGFYYFRNIDNRLLLGGGRNLDLKGEETTKIQETSLIQNKLEELLKTVVLPKTTFEIDRRWSGIMGVGTSKKPIMREISDNIFCGVRLGGMGVAIGSLVGRDLANLVTE